MKLEASLKNEGSGESLASDDFHHTSSVMYDFIIKKTIITNVMQRNGLRSD